VEQHVKILAVLNIVLGGLGVVFALVILVFFGGLAAVAGSDPDPDAQGGAALEESDLSLRPYYPSPA